MPEKPANRTFDFTEPSLFDDDSELFEDRGLFSKHFIEQKRSELISVLSADAVKEAFDQCRQIYERVFKANQARIAHGGLNESDTESELLDPILPLLGFAFLHRTRQDAGLVPDYILYPDENAKTEALNLSDNERYRRAIGILEAKSFNKNLGSISKRETPGYSYTKQMRLYLDQGRMDFKWGILTNGQEWRLYCINAHRDHYFSVYLQSALANLDNFKLVLALFSRGAFLPDVQGSLLLDRLREESYSRQSQLEANLRQRVYVLVEWIAQGFYENNFNRNENLTLEGVYNASLILLYRLMFILYAEARGLLPAHEHRLGSRIEYRRDYSLQRFVPWLKENNLPPEDDVHTTYWFKLVTLFEVINGGNEKVSLRLGIPRYNGGLFDQERHLELTRWRLGDWTVQETLKRLMFDLRPSRDRETIPISSSETIDYSTLSVQQLGSIYEGLLEHKPVPTPDGRIEVKPISEERWLTGSYYTPGWVVDYILQETLKPLLDEIERSEAVQNAKQKDIDDNSFAEAVLKLRILDPAMGSGHFLVGATEYLADEIAYHPTTKTAISKPPRGMTEEWAERAYWRRRVVESCIYGVDKNELAVELAKLSLWLTCISSTNSLSFLDHHLKTGDSLTGTSLNEPLSKYKIEGLTEVRRAAAEAIASIFSDKSDDYDSVKVKEARYKSEAANLLAPFEGLLDHFTGRDFAEKPDEAAFALEMEGLLAQPRLPPRQMAKALDWPLHFELAFPEVFPANGAPPGFDAVIGNPPYVRQESLGALKYYLQRNYTSYQGTADLYVYFIERGLELLKPGG
ncbi:MAG: Eco57I restriction-modification methylase domain-containing protein, partial [Calditrichota bacterium]